MNPDNPTFRNMTFNGFFKSTEVKSASTITVKHEVQDFDLKNIPEEFIVKELANMLADEIVKRNLANLERNLYHKHMVEEFRASINVVPPGHKFMNVENEVFRLDDEEFTEEDIIKALRNTFPERLV